MHGHALEPLRQRVIPTITARSRQELIQRRKTHPDKMYVLSSVCCRCEEGSEAAAVKRACVGQSESEEAELISRNT
jgi:hypothetical protein